MARFLIVLVLTGCSSPGSAPKPAGDPEPVASPAQQPSAPEPAPGTWRCFVVNPNQPELPQGNVTHTKQRLIDGHLETANVHVQHGRAGATRVVYRPAGGLLGNRLESDFHGVTMVAELHQADASHWTLTYHDPSSGWRFTDESRIDTNGLSITSTDPGPPGEDSVVKTTVHFLPAPCEVVDAALARHPPKP